MGLPIAGQTFTAKDGTTQNIDVVENTSQVDENGHFFSILSYAYRKDESVIIRQKPDGTWEENPLQTHAQYPYPEPR